MILAALVGLAALAAVATGIVLVPVDARRGAAVVLALVLLLVGAGSAAPAIVRDAVVFGSAAVLLIGLLAGGRRPARGGPVIAIAVVFLVVVQTVTILNASFATLQFTRLAVLAVLALVAVSGFTARERRMLLTAFITIGVVEAGLGLVEFAVTHRPIPWGNRVYADGSEPSLRNPVLPGSLLRVSGTLGHPIPYSIVLGLAFVALIATARQRPRLLSVTIGAALSAGVLLSGSRTTLIALALALGFLLWTSDATGRAVRILIVTVGVLLGLVVFWPALGASVDRLLGSGSYTNRAGAFEAVPALLGRDPLEMLFGSGYGTDMLLYQRGLFPQNGFWIIDNQLVTTLGTEGLIGLLLVVGFLVTSFLRGDRTRRAFLLILFVTLFSFDYFGWTVVFFLLMVVLALPTARDVERPAEAERTVQNA
ncbi:hypothetical protein EDF24_1034 [Curtobacterium sp. PhB130]|uniref:O-antigen ligase family protein n=1 Tax=unclassified Curtobacterium TaxID=257496 RepID=UPI000F4CCCF5|nr:MULTISPECIES: hypothetical protein [unclassified Curtobacterium]ROS78260.1 hypothetical protein EDF24_1034 [Curtobacterium sp. PhB130]TCK65423.1 hypothetical protein EDF27_0161 [Curtobacterium sp. PhB136]